MLNFLRKFGVNVRFKRSSAIEAKKSVFDQTMRLATELAMANPAGLSDLVRILLRPLQAEFMIDVIEKPKHEARASITRNEFFIKQGASTLFSESGLNNLAGEAYKVHLAKDPVFPCPWHRDRIVSAFAHIGSGKTCGQWKQDFTNHHLTLWLPWRIAFVNGGNHSITAGIAAGEGVLQPDEVFDLSHVLEQVRCDGLYYRSIENGTILAEVKDPRVAAVFEIGRLMVLSPFFQGDGGGVRGNYLI